MRRWRSEAASLIAALSLGCLPDFDDRPSEVVSARILAVIAEPAEALPGDAVSFRVVVAGPEGAVELPLAYWALCLVPKPPAENNAVHQACWDESYLPVAGPAEVAEIVIPEDACARFGPEIPTGELRPRDPDATGGYYQPVRVAIPELAAFGFARIRCPLANASGEVTLAFNESYRANTNPTGLVLELIGADGALVAPEHVRGGSTLTLRASWDEASREAFPVYDQATGRLDTQREDLRVSWFATFGAMSTDVTDADGSRSETDWQVPDAAGQVTLWAVLRDSRGGAAFVFVVVTIGD